MGLTDVEMYVQVHNLKTRGGIVLTLAGRAGLNIRSGKPKILFGDRSELEPIPEDENQIDTLIVQSNAVPADRKTGNGVTGMGIAIDARNVTLPQLGSRRWNQAQPYVCRGGRDQPIPTPRNIVRSAGPLARCGGINNVFALDWEALSIAEMALLHWMAQPQVL